MRMLLLLFLWFRRRLIPRVARGFTKAVAAFVEGTGLGFLVPVHNGEFMAAILALAVLLALAFALARGVVVAGGCDAGSRAEVRFGCQG